MNELDPYIRVHILMSVNRIAGDRAVRRIEMRDAFYSHIKKSLGPHGDSPAVIDINVLADDLIDEFVANGIISEISESLTGKYYRYDHEKYLEYKAVEVAKSPLTHFFYEVGDGFMNDAIIGFVTKNSEAGIPASDRLVSPSHNREHAKEISEGLEQIANEIAKSNEAFQGDAQARDAALSEVSSLRAMWDSAQVRILIFQQRSSQTLEWVAEKAASTAITEICRHVLKLILGWS